MNLKEVLPNKYVYHTSNPIFRDKISKEGLITKGKSETWLSDTKIDGKVIFAVNSNNPKDWWDSTYDDDIYRIDTTNLNNKWYNDPNFDLKDKRIITFEDIPLNSIKIIHKGLYNMNLAPNGKPSNLTPEQYKLVRTPEFKAWFGFWDLYNYGKAKNYYEPSVKKIAKELKEEKLSAINEAVDFLSKQVTENDVLIPMPSRYGIAKDTRKLAQKISEKTGAKLFDCLVGKKRESVYEMKKNKQDLYNFDFNFQINCEIPKAKNYFIVDNVIGTGVTMKNALQKVIKNVGTNVSPLVFAIDLNNISKVVDENGEPLVVWHSSPNYFNVFDAKKSVKGLFHFGTIQQAIYRLTYYIETIGFDITPYIKLTNEQEEEMLETDIYWKLVSYILLLNFYDKNDVDVYFENIFTSKQKEYLKTVKINIDKNKIKSELDKYNIKPYFLRVKKLGKTNDVGENWELDSSFFEGYMYINLHEGNKKEYSFVVFEPNQIKLADGTNTTFDSNNPDIRYAEGGSINEFIYEIGGL